ncbi:MAG: DUF4340 domain-containing protein, partial [Nitrospinales bacterium]
MRFHTTIKLAVILIGIVLYYFYIDLPAEKKKTEEKERSEKILLFNPEDVKEFSLIKINETFSLKRGDNGQWEIVQPINVKADPQTVSDLISQIENARFTRIVDESPADLSTYGLENPSLKFLIKLKDQTEKTLLFGDESPIGSSIYVKLDDDNRVVLSPNFRRSINKSLYDLRDKTILDFATDEVSSFEIQRQDLGLQFKRDKNNWNIQVDNSIYKGDSTAIQSFLNAVRNARVASFVDENPMDLQTFGLDSAAIHLTIHKGEKDEPLTLLIGDQNKEFGYYAKMGVNKNVVLLNNEIIAKLSQNLSDFRDKTLFEFKKEQIAEVHLTSADEEIWIKRGEDENNPWKIIKPLQTPADKTTLNNLFIDLKNLRAHLFLDNPIEDTKHYGIEDSKKQLILTSEEGQSFKLTIGNMTNDQKYVFASRESDSSIFLLEKDKIEKIFPTLHRLRNKKLLSFKMEDVERILIEYPDQTFELQKKESDWNLLKPQVIKKIKPFIGQDTVWTLNNLSFESIVEESVEPGVTGLDQPTVKVSLWEKGSKKP